MRPKNMGMGFKGFKEAGQLNNKDGSDDDDDDDWPDREHEQGRREDRRGER